MKDNEMTDKQIKLLLLIAPSPLGEGLTIKKAAAELGISERSAYSRLCQFKKSNPKEYTNFLSIVGAARRNKDSIVRPRCIDNDMFTVLENMGLIKETF